MRLLLGLTGSVATIKAGELIAGLQQAGHDLRVVITAHAEHFYDFATVNVPVYRDADEWPGQYQRGDDVLHIELRRWAEGLLIAPLDAHTLAKLAGGLCDNLLTCIVRSWEPTRPIWLAPAMNTLMWQHPATRRHLDQVLADMPACRIIDPVIKTLACGDVGPGAMAEVPIILQTLSSTLSAVVDPSRV